ncbi:MAG TPA: sn-glycerol-3-phosphate ABC transporter ATP-binding protein UgpC [Candidatus Hydrogenedens sp.]|nr:sn-glycerol-3-phosphate ABC transporter ATP-binding protein UgpC [Candidatus Hydrogenedens sp.]
MAQVELKRLTKIYPNGLVAVKDVTLTIEDKEFIVLVGPSGCGKTTTLRMVAGLEEISSGDIYIDGKWVNNVHPKDRDIAMVFQNYALYPHMTVYKNMAFGLMLRGISKQEIDKRVREAAEILGLTDYLGAKPRVLSGGQRQRVAVGRAIVRNPKVFLFDEPLSNLDAKMRVQMRAEISKLHHHLKATIIYVTHDQIEAMTMGDRIVVMNNGMVQQIGTPLELYNRPVNKFVAGFIGSPPMNMIEGTIIEKKGNLYFSRQEENIELKIPVTKQGNTKTFANKQVILGIRPEDITNNQNQIPKLGISIPATVEVVEPTGAEMNLYLNTGTTTITARVKMDNEPPIGKPYVVDIDVEKIHLFDPTTEQVIV